MRLTAGKKYRASYVFREHCAGQRVGRTKTAAASCR
jgi:hypothetical protein